MGKLKEKKSGLRGVLSSPLLVAVAAAVVVVFALSFVNYVRRGGFWSSEVEAKVFTSGSRGGGKSSGVDAKRVFAFQGEVFSDAERLREASALSLAGMLLAAQRNLDRQPITSVEGLLSSLRADGAIPPGMELDESGTAASSAYGIYYVRYRRSPLAVEVVSVGKERLSGAPFLVRLPDDEFSQNALTYYVAPKAEGSVMVPGAFSPPVQIISMGWEPVTFKSNGVSADDAEKGKQWLASGK
jgi:hypothetical protein